MAKEEQIIIKKPNIKTIQFDIKGTQPLIMHKWDEKAKKMMLDKMQMKTVKRDAKDPDREFKNSMYLLSNGNHPKGPYGFPAVGFKSAAVRAAKQTTMAMTDARSLFYVVPDDGDLVEIKSDQPVMREDIMRIKQTVDIRYRGQFNNWSAKLTVKYNSDSISDEQILNLFELAGFSAGIGEWRMERGGTFGSFTLVL